MHDDSNSIRISAAELKSRANLHDVWAGLGGGPIKHNRGVAFWRGGKNLNVSLDLKGNRWHDFVTGDGGDVIGLIRVVCGCDFPQACKWLADFLGLNLSVEQPRQDRSWRGDLQRATYWSLATEHM